MSDYPQSKRLRADSSILEKLPKPKVTVIGMGAIGGVLAAALHTAGRCDLTCLARGAALRTLQSRGLDLRCPFSDPPGLIHVDCAFVDVSESKSLGPQDVVIVATKSHQIPLNAIQPLLKECTVVVLAMNGLPFWFFYRFGERLEGSHLQSVDPGGLAWKTIGPQCTLGCIVMITGHTGNNYAEWVSDWNPDKNHLVIGDPDRTLLHEPCSPRAAAFAALFVGADPKCKVRVVHTKDIRGAILDKLAINCAMNSITALTRSKCDAVARDGGTQRVLRQVVAEVASVAKALGLFLSRDADDILLIYKPVHASTSMLTDIEENRNLETDGILRAFVELATLIGVAVPTIDTLLALLDLAEQSICPALSSCVLERRRALHSTLKV